MDFKDTCKMRRSVRAFKEEQITKEALQAVLDAAYLAPTGMGKYENLTLIVVQDADALAALKKEFAKTAPPGHGGDPTYGAPTLIYVCENASDNDVITFANAGVMMESMLLAAADNGLGGCYLLGCVMANATNHEIDRIIGLPEGFRPVSAIALGLPAEAADPREADRNKINTLFV